MLNKNWRNPRRKSGQILGEQMDKNQKDVCRNIFKTYVSAELPSDLVSTYHDYLKKNCNMTEGDLIQARNPREPYRY